MTRPDRPPGVVPPAPPGNPRYCTRGSAAPPGTVLISRKFTQPLRRTFYKLDGPWYRCRLYEALGSRRYSRPALHALDVLLERYADFDGGVFVEAGAHDGYTQSNTYYLERYRGWTGVLIEPVPAQYRKCVRRRPGSRTFNCALVADGFAAETVTVQTGDLMSTVSGAGGAMADPAGHAEVGSRHVRRPRRELQVPVMTLSAVLDAAGVSDVDLLSLDVEGFEMEALRGLDRTRHRPRLLLIEMLDADAMQPEFDRLLASDYVPVTRLTACDVLYEARDPAR